MCWPGSRQPRREQGARMIKQICTVPGYERIHPRYHVSSFGEVLSERNGRTLKLQPMANNDGYLQCTLYDHDGTPRRMAISRLVLSAFDGPSPSPDHQCDHRDSNRQNNQITNLRWL